MTRDKLICDLERAADDVGALPRRELETFLRRAAILLRNTPTSDDQWTPAADTNPSDDDPGAA
jgi:hypothetical protein